MRIFKLLTSILLIFIICFYVFAIPSFATDYSYIWNSDVLETSTNITEEANSEISDDNFLGLDCGSAILIEQETGKVLYAHNIHEQLYPASVTKVMSILLIMEALDSGKISLTDEVPCSENAASMGGSQIWLDPRETLTVDEMLKAICVNSANDRCCCNG